MGKLLRKVSLTRINAGGVVVTIFYTFANVKIIQNRYWQKN